MPAISTLKSMLYLKPWQTLLLLVILFAGAWYLSYTSGQEEGVGEQMVSDTPPPEKVRVVTVEDAVTFVADSGQRIRYLGVRTPLGGDAEQCFGQEALAAQQAIIGKEVRLEEDPVLKRSQDGAWMRYVFMSDDKAQTTEEATPELFISERILDGGFGFLLASQDMKYGQRLQLAARYAASTGKGLWRVCKPYQDDTRMWQTETL
ncbi:MAG: thermonuclease family protein [Candidatus Andersenbacteria bacterium]|nr:thermonuclease family protein [Candidatus Andersenbacteria bacterium]MBI3250784.1 thermonuclease family protein [Candidatus Andersenbacteria bacterium]